jgi:hypothetical protein
MEVVAMGGDIQRLNAAFDKPYIGVTKRVAPWRGWANV